MDGSILEETGWMNGIKFTDKGNWGMCYYIEVLCGEDCTDGGGGEEGLGCGTGFAKDDVNDKSTCFLNNNFERWRWTNGEISYGTYSFSLWVGAGQCNLNAGTLVGTVTLIYNMNKSVSVKYTLLAGYVLQETHLYVGNTAYPQVKVGEKLVSTVAPGQYPYQHSNLNNVQIDEYTFTNTNLLDNIYIIAHAVVCSTN